MSVIQPHPTCWCGEPAGYLQRLLAGGELDDPVCGQHLTRNDYLAVCCVCGSDAYDGDVCDECLPALAV